MAANFKLPKVPRGSMNFSIINDAGETLSFAADDSCGVSTYYIRTYLLRYDRYSYDLAPEQCDITPEQYLAALADHLGYILTKKEG